MQLQNMENKYFMEIKEEQIMEEEKEIILSEEQEKEFNNGKGDEENE